MLPRVLDAMSQWVDAVSSAAARQKGVASYLDLCDGVRDDVLPALGVRLEDRPEGPLWKLDDPAVLARERADKLRAAAEASRKKVENKLAIKGKELDKLRAASVPPAQMFRALTDKYSKFDDAVRVPCPPPWHTPLKLALSLRRISTLCHILRASQVGVWRAIAGYPDACGEWRRAQQKGTARGRKGV